MSNKKHPSVMDGKRWCSRVGNCFGVGVHSFSGAVSFTFPMKLKKGEFGDWFIYKKESILGIACLYFKTILNLYKIAEC